MVSHNQVFALLIAFGVSLVSVLVLKHVAIKVNLVDTPDHRKTHAGQVPLVGGLSIFLGVVSTFAFFPASGIEITALLIAAIMIVLVGLVDDHLDIKVWYRLTVQLLASLVITVGSGVTIDTLGVFGAGASFELGWFAVPFTVFSFMVAMNAFNFLDGIDGLSGLMFMVAILAIIVMCIWGSGIDLANYIVPLIFFIAVIPYMFLNLGLLGRKNRIFLGDAGSMLLGLAVAWLIVRYTQGSTPVFSPVSGLWFIAVPLMDMLAIVMRRVSQGRAPFHPDRNHLHHLFMDHGMSDRKALLVIGILSMILAGIGILSEIYSVSQLVMLIAFLVIFFSYYKLMSHFEKQIPLQQAQQ